MTSFIRIIRFAKQYWNLALYNVFFNILSIIFSVVSIALLIPFLDLLFNQKELVLIKPEFRTSLRYFLELFQYYLSIVIDNEGTRGGLLFICVVLVVVFFLKNLFRFMAMYMMATIRNGTVRNIRNVVFEKVIRLNLGYFSDKKKGDIISRVSSDVNEVEISIMSTLEVLVKSPLTIIVFLIVMFYTSYQLTLFALILLPVTSIIIGRLGKRLKKPSLKGQAKLGLLLSIIEESLSGLRIIKAFNAEKKQSDKFKRENLLYYRLMRKIYIRRETASPVSEVLGIMILATLLWFGGKLVLAESDDFNPAPFIFFMVLFSQMINPLKAFSTAFFNIQKGMASAHRIQELMDTPILIRESANPVSIKEFNSSIEYKDVSFSYEKSVVLDNINLKIEKGQTIALVGPSGAGKSTMADLLPRFYDPSHGEILIDGIAITEYKIGDLRKLMGIVTQDSILFNDTVFNNLSFGVTNATEEEVINAARIANAHDFIEKMEKGYETNIGDEGMKLSGGERQRLSIARAILKNPQILILDEATSSLDSQSEKLVKDALLNLMKNRTSLVIAHRLSTIQHADHIIVIDNGRIIEQGDHNNLLAKSGKYKKLVELQAF